MKTTDKDVEEYISTLQYSEQIPDIAITLVAGNIRGFWQWLQERDLKVDMNDPDVIKEIDELKKEQREITSNANRNIQAEMKSIIITI